MRYGQTQNRVQGLGTTSQTASLLLHSVLCPDGDTRMRIICCPDTGEFATTYPYYLQTQHWRHMRNVKRMEGVCAGCGESITDDFDVHHLTYDTLGHESPDDLALMHPACHAMLHGFTPNGRGLTPVSAIARFILARLVTT